MSYMNDSYPDENNTIYINGNEEELIPGLNDVMAKMAELYIDCYMDSDYLDKLDEDERITIDFTRLSDKEMHELISCALMCVELETSGRGSSFLS